jgi:hypothetical protein
VDRYDVALNINTLGPQRLLNFAHRCPNLQLFMHVSTGEFISTKFAVVLQRTYHESIALFFGFLKRNYNEANIHSK